MPKITETAASGCRRGVPPAPVELTAAGALDIPDDAKFPLKVFMMINHCDRHDPGIACWTPDGNAFIVRDPERLASEYLEKCKVCQSPKKGPPKFSSFVRQLNLYGFKNVARGRDSQHAIFCHKNFAKGTNSMLDKIARKSKASDEAKAFQGEELQSVSAEVEMRLGQIERTVEIHTSFHRETKDELQSASVSLGRLEGDLQSLFSKVDQAENEMKSLLMELRLEVKQLTFNCFCERCDGTKHCANTSSIGLSQETGPSASIQCPTPGRQEQACGRWTEGGNGLVTRCGSSNDPSHLGQKQGGGHCRGSPLPTQQERTPSQKLRGGKDGPPQKPKASISAVTSCPRTEHHPERRKEQDSQPETRSASAGGAARADRRDRQRRSDHRQDGPRGFLGRRHGENGQHVPPLRAHLGTQVMQGPGHQEETKRAHQNPGQSPEQTGNRGSPEERAQPEEETQSEHHNGHSTDNSSPTIVPAYRGGSPTRTPQCHKGREQLDGGNQQSSSPPPRQNIRPNSKKQTHFGQSADARRTQKCPGGENHHIKTAQGPAGDGRSPLPASEARDGTDGLTEEALDGFLLSYFLNTQGVPTFDTQNTSAATWQSGEKRERRSSSFTASSETVTLTDPTHGGVTSADPSDQVSIASLIKGDDLDLAAGSLSECEPRDEGPNFGQGATARPDSKSRQASRTGCAKMPPAPFKRRKNYETQSLHSSSFFPSDGTAPVDSTEESDGGMEIRLTLGEERDREPTVSRATFPLRQQEESSNKDELKVSAMAKALFKKQWRSPTQYLRCDPPLS